jgi:hypothetical protein
LIVRANAELYLKAKRWFLPLHVDQWRGSHAAKAANRAVPGLQAGLTGARGIRRRVRLTRIQGDLSSEADAAWRSLIPDGKTMIEGAEDTGTKASLLTIFSKPWAKKWAK